MWSERVPWDDRATPSCPPLSGGGALLRNLAERISKETGVPCFQADEAILCVAKGTGAILENLDLYKKSVMVKK